MIHNSHCTGLHGTLMV